MTGLLHSLCMVVAWMAALYRLQMLVFLARDIAAFILCCSCFLLALSFTFSTPSVWSFIDRFTGVPNLAGLATQGCMLLFAASVNVLVLLWSHPREDAWRKICGRLLLFGLALSLSIILLSLRPAAESRPTDFVAANAGEPYFAGSLLLYVIGFGATLLGAYRLSTQQMAHCDRPWLRRGLRFISLGSIFGMVHCLARFADVVGARLGFDPHEWETVALLGGDGGEVLFLMGWTVPSVGPALSAMRGWIRSLRDYHRLYPLWAALYAAIPSIALDPPRSRRADLLNLRDLEFRLYRRFIEIQDGLLMLQPHMDHRAAARARLHAERRGMRPDRIEAITEAACFRDALCAMSSGMREPTPAGHARAKVGPQAVADLDRLVKVAGAFANSPIVPSAMKAVADGPITLSMSVRIVGKLRRSR